MQFQIAKIQLERDAANEEVRKVITEKLNITEQNGELEQIIIRQTEEIEKMKAVITQLTTERVVKQTQESESIDTTNLAAPKKQKDKSNSKLGEKTDGECLQGQFYLSDCQKGEESFPITKRLWEYSDKSESQLSSWDCLQFSSIVPNDSQEGFGKRGNVHLTSSASATTTAMSQNICTKDFSSDLDLTIGADDKKHFTMAVLAYDIRNKLSEKNPEQEFLNYLTNNSATPVATMMMRLKKIPNGFKGVSAIHLLARYSCSTVLAELESKFGSQSNFTSLFIAKDNDGKTPIDHCNNFASLAGVQELLGDRYTKTLDILSKQPGKGI